MHPKPYFVTDPANTSPTETLAVSPRNVSSTRRFGQTGPGSAVELLCYMEDPGGMENESHELGSTFPSKTARHYDVSTAEPCVFLEVNSPRWLE